MYAAALIVYSIILLGSSPGCWAKMSSYRSGLMVKSAKFWIRRFKPYKIHKRMLTKLYNKLFFYISRSRAGVARQAHNLKVEGSIPSSATY